MELNELTVTQALDGLKKKTFSAEELVKSCFGKIKKVEEKVKAFITICEEDALKNAKKTDQLIKDDPQIFEQKPLLGMPIALKDLFSTKGIKTTAGSKVLKDYIPVYDATVVKKLKAAGAIIIGKTNLDAWGHGSSGENSDFFVTKNPWNLQKTPGGSSSGSGAAVSAGECLAATATDTCGSVRAPANFCNLVGLKPTYGRVSRFGVIAMASSLDSIGHLAHTVEDSALFLKVTAGKDPLDATTPNIKVEDYSKTLKKPSKKIIIGLPKEYFIKGIDKEMKLAIESSIKLFEKNGFIINTISLPHTQYALATYYIIQPSEVSSNLARFDGIRYGEKRDCFGEEAKRRIILGTYSLSTGYYDAYYLKAMKVRTLISEDFAKAFAKVDILLTPTSPTPAFNLGEKIKDPLKMYLSDIFSASSSLAGLPVLALPCGFTKDNLPIGMQLIAPQFNESLLFQVGHYFQQITTWHKRRPPLV